MIINLKQGSDEWLQYRRNSVTATDFAVIAADAGLCKYPFSNKKTVDKLIQDKLSGKILPDNPYFARGREYERFLIDQLQSAYVGLDVSYGEVHALESNGRIMASLDGTAHKVADGDSFFIIEAKTSRKDMGSYDLEGYYKYQIAHQCYCSNIDTATLVIAWFDDKPGKMSDNFTITATNIVASEVINKGVWLKMCEGFLIKLDNAKAISDQDLSLFDEYKQCDSNIKVLEKRKDIIKEELIKKYPQGASFKEYSISKISRNTTKYANFIKDNNYSIPEQYVIQSISYTIKENK